MATLRIEDGEVVVALSRWEKVSAVHGDVRVPLSSVEDVSVSAQPFGELRGLRAPGAGWPRGIALGTWRYRGGKDFAALYRRRPAVIVGLRDAGFERLLISVDDAEAVAARIRAAA
jgi:hypothetical protein